jgi:hypothetical protein
MNSVLVQRRLASGASGRALGRCSTAGARPLTLHRATTAVVQYFIKCAAVEKPLPYCGRATRRSVTHDHDFRRVSHRAVRRDVSFYRRANHAFSGIAAYRVADVNVGSVSASAGGTAGDDNRAERVAAGRVSATLFGVLGVPALRGRTLTDDDDRPGAPPVVVLGQRLWERKFGGDPAVVGRRLQIDGVSREIVGVMPARFRLPTAKSDLWVPLGIDPANTASAAFDYRGVARLRDGVSLQAAAADLQRLLPDVPVAFPGRLTVSSISQIRMQAVVTPLRDVVVGDVGRVLWVVLGAVGCVLLVACANVMNLFLVRAEAGNTRSRCGGR